MPKRRASWSAQVRSILAVSLSKNAKSRSIEKFGIAPRTSNH
jgi:hypothetical protein